MWTYARRAVGWTALLGSTSFMAALLATSIAWPERFGSLVVAACLPLVVAVALILDEPALAVVRVAPRTTLWRATSRVLAAALPLGGWGLGVWLLAGRLDQFALTGWLLIGGATAAATLGSASLLVRHGSPAPGTSVSSLMVLLLALPFVRSPLPASVPVYPLGGFPQATAIVWWIVLLLGLVSLVLGLRNVPRR